MAHVIVAGVLIHAGRVLLGHRSPGRRSYPDCWDLPGGHVEPGERRERALARELREELGIEAVIGGAPALHLEHRPDLEHGFVMDVWTVTRWSGRVVNAAEDEHDDLRWFAAEQLAGLALAHPGYERFLAGLLGIDR